MEFERNNIGNMLETPHKTRKPSYKKPEAVRELERMADAEARRSSSNMSAP